VRQRFIAGIDLGASNVRVVLCDEDGEVAARRDAPFGGGPPEPALQSMRRTIDDLARSIWASARVAAIGIALPGTVDPERGLVATPANLPGWGNVTLTDVLAADGIPVAAENDANAAAVGEGWLGAAREAKDYIFIALGTGIGAGLVLGGKLHHGAHLMAGEVAFAPMTREQLGTPGWDHNLEALVGGRAMAAKAKDLLGDRGTPAALFAAAWGGDERAVACVREMQEHLAMAIAAMCALADPQLVVVGGGVAAAQGERLVSPVRDMVQRVLPVRIPLVLSALGRDAQVLGAVRLALDRLHAGA
jgi:glucokinase